MNEAWKIWIEGFVAAKFGEDVHKDNPYLNSEVQVPVPITLEKAWHHINEGGKP